MSLLLSYKCQPEVPGYSLLNHVKVTSSISVGAEAQVNCDFENGICGWRQALDDAFDWSRHKGETNTPHTGPGEDHTIGDGGYYVYIENNSPQATGDTAKLVSEEIMFESNQTKCLKFWYHMHGVHIAELSVHVLEHDDRHNRQLWLRQGTQGDEWKMAQVTIVTGDEMGMRRIIFEGVHGGLVQGDIAIDDISLVDGACLPQDLVCNFEDAAWCGGSQDSNDDFDWSMSGGTFGSGVDHTYGSAEGYFLYVQASDVTKEKTARFMTSTYDVTTSGYCLEFFFKVTGQKVATLNVYVSQGGVKGDAIWSRTPQLGEGWMIAQVNIGSVSSNYQLIFEAVRGKGNAGFLGVDDIRLMDKQCASLASCTFEDGLCTWENTYRFDNLDWVQNKGGTGTGNTGPKNDHTIGNGTYVYVEASNSLINSYGSIYSEIVPADSTDDSCLEFWYHMRGGGIGELRVDHVTETNVKVTELWSVKGDQGEEWLYGRVGVPRSKDCQVTFTAVRGTGPSGDIALDDIQLSSGFCEAIPEFHEPTPQPIEEGGETNVVGIIVGTLVGVAVLVAVVFAGLFFLFRYRKTQGSSYDTFKHEDKSMSAKNLSQLEVTAGSQ